MQQPSQPMKGSITCVGTGMTLGSHITPLSKDYIAKADVVFGAASDALVEQWLAEQSRDYRSLQKHYCEGLDRRKSYQAMVDEMLSEVRQGKHVVGAFYGHPGVFAWAPHKVIEVARSEGFSAHMEPGISAADCLIADLNIDPGKHGIIHYEASQYMLYRKSIDPSAYLVLWQISLAGDQTMAKFFTPASYRQILTDKLLQTYPANHQVVIYQCPTLPLEQFSAKHINLGDLAHCEVSQHSTLIVPPSVGAEKDLQTQEKLEELAKPLD